MEATGTANGDYSSDQFEPILAELVVGEVTARSWVFRFIDWTSSAFEKCVGIVSIIFCTAIMANIPILQFVSFGYLLEVSGRLARGGKLSDAMVGVTKAARIGAVLLGTWLLLIPIRFFSDAVWYEAHLIDPDSLQTFLTRVVQFLLIGLTVIQILAAWICGGKLRYFFWQVIAPFSMGVWIFRKILGSSILRPVLNLCFRWVSPNLVNDLVNAQPPTDWFVPAIVYKKMTSGCLYRKLRDGLWDFVFSLNLWYYFKLGIVGFVGTVIWLIVPTLFLIGATQFSGGAAIACGVLGAVTAIPVFSILLLIQTHYARERSWSSFWRVGQVLTIFRQAPVFYVLAMLFVLVFALPLFFLKIEEIPSDLLWTLSLVFIMFSWPSRILLGLAYRRAAKKESIGRWWVRWPEMAMAMPIAAMFAVILSTTRYVSWNGALSLMENHVFLLPAPFWL